MNINIPLHRTELIFGLLNKSSESLENYVILCVKYYIWTSKFEIKTPSLTSFKKMLKTKLDDIKYAYIWEEREDKFEKWQVLYDDL